MMVERDEKEELRQKIEVTRERILDILAEIDDITLQQNPRILSDYMVKVGVWENELLSEQIAARRAKRRCELFQAAANRGESVTANQVEATLDKEFAEWEMLLGGKVEAYAAAVKRRVGMEAMDQKEVAEFKSLYRTISKRLHPDLCAGDAEMAAELFMVARRAYEAGDVEALRSLEIATKGFEKKDDLTSMGQDELSAELALAEARLTLLEESLDVLKATEPYCLAEKLANPSWVCERVSALKEQIEQAKGAQREYARRVRALKGVA